MISTLYTISAISTISKIWLQIWSEDITSPLQWAWSGEHRITHALWSPVRPSVIFATRDDGYLMVGSFLWWNIKTFN